MKKSRFMHGRIPVTSHPAHAPRFWAAIEYTNPGEAIVTLMDSAGEWAGAGLVQVKSGLRADLYEAGYRLASSKAAAKGGILDRYSEVA